TVREKNARQVLEEVGVRREIHVTADPAFLLTPEPLPDDALQREGLADEQRLVGVSVREPGLAAPDMDEEDYHGLRGDAADYMVGPPMKDVNAGQLIAHIDRSWDFREQLRERIARAVPLLQERARETNRIVARVLGHEADPKH